MRTFTTEHTVYTFDELSGEAKAKALQHERELEERYGLEDTLPDRIRDIAEELLNKADIEFTDMKPRYSLGYAQGDGAMVEGLFTYKGATFRVEQRGLYSHERSGTITDYFMDGTSDGDVPGALYDEFSDKLISLNVELGKRGYEEIDYLLSDGVLTDMIDANEYEFYKDGTRA